VLAAALLHLEAGMRSSHYRIHFALGQALVESTFGRQAPIRPRVLWYLLAATYRHARGDLADARRCLQAGIEIVGRDAELLTALGAVQETSAGPFAESRDPRLVSIWDQTRRLQQPDTRDSLNRARRAYREAIQSNPMAAEARLRLGWVEHLLGSHDAALRELEPLQDSTEPDVAYLARLFVGRLLEGTNPNSAEGCFRAALRQMPEGQAAAIALARLLHSQGKRQEGWRVLSQSFEGYPAPVHSRDPWWDYPFGGVRRMARWSEEVRAAVRAGHSGRASPSF
jgi:tetratricopeptide (TPR) repeat protein